MNNMSNYASFAERLSDATQNSDSLSRIPKGNSSTDEPATIRDSAS